MPACALHPGNARDVWDGLLAKAEKQPLPAPGAGPGASVTALQLRLGIRALLFPQSAWPQLARAIARAEAGDAAGFVRPPVALPTRNLALVARTPRRPCPLPPP